MNGLSVREGKQRRILVKTLLLSGARVSESVAIRSEDLLLDEVVLHLGARHSKRGDSALVNFRQGFSGPGFLHNACRQQR